ncbi:unnamed protein product [Gongylonema pulchrum]|uniref:Uncharacterized protein n=1 Tax=Gongylonema pulchrum TaxID=637853 RepID=A0A183EZX4_9BILA|nr:unnamed protein product [Gongylonema pulchrum]
MSTPLQPQIIAEESTTLLNWPQYPTSRLKRPGQGIQQCALTLNSQITNGRNVLCADWKAKMLLKRAFIKPKNERVLSSVFLFP